MRKLIAILALGLSTVVFVGTQPALAVGRTTGSTPAYVNVPVECVDAFTAMVTQHDPRTLTTWTDRQGKIVLQTLRTKTATEYSGGSGGLMQLDENSLLTIKPNPDGTSTLLFVGRGAIWGTETTLGQSFFQWVTGVALMKGTFDMKSGSFLVSSKTILGQTTDLCDSLTTGLKPRH
ncbi:MAG: hypothetical protein ABI595_07060 [Actinomycetota bacterium]